MSRYADDPEYRRDSRRREHRSERDHGHRERVEPARDRRTMDDRIPRDTRMEDVMDTRMDTRIDPRMASRIDPRDARIDPRMDVRTEPRASTATRIDPRAGRGMDGRSAEPDGLGQIFRDPVTGEYYREVSQVPSRSPYPPRDERGYDDPPPRRQPVDAPMGRERESLRPELNEYFCPGDGIDREVIQHEICKYLGQDATCRPGRNPADGRSGYLVKAYRPFTTAMEQSLRDDTIKWQRERERRARQGQSRGTPYSVWTENRPKDRVGSYADMQARQERERQSRYPGEMDLDEDDAYGPRSQRQRDPDPRDVRSMTGGRVPVPVTSGYAPEPGYPASYTISSTRDPYVPGQPAYYGADREPRTFGGNTPPTVTRAGQSTAYVQPGGGYPVRTGSSTSSSIPAPYGGGDPRREMMGGGGYPPSGYTDSRRHR
ncbi:hypothetical protein EDD37DRAFT_646818 [Exophiala viscosa]|uniref:Uncharacterized protein n=1 Tax=Exophiala viscosa TaxID=2486360 RepID=A0AAN6E4T8_9EURO|nr:hypothetical protein EDD36DRAFT_18752 [Exophiala viscosa]KAI1627130.1 hypothetical protein EDD37DRAFT_646818 [Exophiala viscosa]